MSRLGAAILEFSEQDTTDQLTNPFTPIISRHKPTQPYIPEGSQKRELSLGSTPSPSSSQNEGKRSRHFSSEFDETLAIATITMLETETEVTMLDLLNLLKQTAKISDLDDVAKEIRSD